MAKEKKKEIENPEEVVAQAPVRESKKDREERLELEKLQSWNPKTKLGKKVRSGEIKSIDAILDGKLKILEPQITDTLIKTQSDLISIGQAKGKFGGGKRRAWKQTQKKTEEGNVATFAAMAVVGDRKGHVGAGRGRAKETLPARDKAIRQAKLNVIKVVRACGSFDCACSELHSIPFKVEGKCGSVRVVLYPAPQGTGLVIGDECKKVLKLAGISDVYSKTFGKTNTSKNMVEACIDALKKTNRIGVKI